jgi:26S proteasome regulatory subunit T5
MPSRLTGCALQAVAVEAGMLALRRGGTELRHEDYVEGVTVVQAKKKASLNYYA